MHQKKFLSFFHPRLIILKSSAIQWANNNPQIAYSFQIFSLPHSHTHTIIFIYCHHFRHWPLKKKKRKRDKNLLNLRIYFLFGTCCLLRQWKWYLSPAFVSWSWEEIPLGNLKIYSTFSLKDFHSCFAFARWWINLNRICQNF